MKTSVSPWVAHAVDNRWALCNCCYAARCQATYGHSSLLRSDNYPASDRYHYLLLYYTNHKRIRSAVTILHTSLATLRKIAELFTKWSFKKNIRQNSRWLNRVQQRKTLAFKSVLSIVLPFALFYQSLMRSDQKKLTNFEKNFRKLHVNNSFVFGSEVCRSLLIHFSIRILMAKPLSCCLPLTASARKET